MVSPGEAVCKVPGALALCVCSVVCAPVCVRTRVRVPVHECVRVSVCVCVRACLCVVPRLAGAPQRREAVPLEVASGKLGGPALSALNLLPVCTVLAASPVRADLMTSCVRPWQGTAP